MCCIIKYSYQLFSLFALTHGETLNFSVVNGYVNKTETAKLNCQLSTALADLVDIFWNAKHAFNCVGGGCNPQLPSNYSDFSATQNDLAGTTVVTILNATKERDEVKWTCNYGTTLSADVNLTVTCPASNSSRLIEESGYITLELICTCPYTSLDLTFYLGADNYTEVIPSKTVNNTACSSTYEASVNYTLILPLQHLKSYNGTFNIFVNNGFYTARFSGSRLYNFTAATTSSPPLTTDTSTTSSTTSQTTHIGTNNQKQTSPTSTTKLQTNESEKDSKQIIIISASVSGGVILLGVLVIIIWCRRGQKKAVDDVVDRKDIHGTPNPQCIDGLEENDFTESNLDREISSGQINLSVHTSNHPSIPRQDGKDKPLPMEIKEAEHVKKETTNL